MDQPDGQHESQRGSPEKGTGIYSSCQRGWRGIFSGFVNCFCLFGEVIRSALGWSRRSEDYGVDIEHIETSSTTSGATTVSGFSITALEDSYVHFELDDCDFVAGLVNESGDGRFYDLKISRPDKYATLSTDIDEINIKLPCDTVVLERSRSDQPQNNLVSLERKSQVTDISLENGIGNTDESIRHIGDSELQAPNIPHTTAAEIQEEVQCIISGNCQKQGALLAHTRSKPADSVDNLIQAAAQTLEIERQRDRERDMGETHQYFEASAKICKTEKKDVNPFVITKPTHTIEANNKKEEAAVLRRKKLNVKRWIAKNGPPQKCRMNPISNPKFKVIDSAGNKIPTSLLSNGSFCIQTPSDDTLNTEDAKDRSDASPSLSPPQPESPQQHEASDTSPSTRQKQESSHNTIADHMSGTPESTASSNHVEIKGVITDLLVKPGYVEGLGAWRLPVGNEDVINVEGFEEEVNRLQGWTVVSAYSEDPEEQSNNPQSVIKPAFTPKKTVPLQSSSPSNETKAQAYKTKIPILQTYIIKETSCSEKLNVVKDIDRDNEKKAPVCTERFKVQNGIEKLRVESCTEKTKVLSTPMKKKTQRYHGKGDAYNSTEKQKHQITCERGAVVQDNTEEKNNPKPAKEHITSVRMQNKWYLLRIKQVGPNNIRVSARHAGSDTLHKVNDPRADHIYSMFDISKPIITKQYQNLNYEMRFNFELNGRSMDIPPIKCNRTMYCLAQDFAEAPQDKNVKHELGFLVQKTATDIWLEEEVKEPTNDEAELTTKPNVQTEAKPKFQRKAAINQNPEPFQLNSEFEERTLKLLTEKAARDKKANEKNVEKGRQHTTEKSFSNNGTFTVPGELDSYKYCFKTVTDIYHDVGLGFIPMNDKCIQIDMDEVVDQIIKDGNGDGSKYTIDYHNPNFDIGSYRMDDHVGATKAKKGIIPLEKLKVKTRGIPNKHLNKAFDGDNSFNAEFQFDYEDDQEEATVFGNPELEESFTETEIENKRERSFLEEESITLDTRHIEALPYKVLPSKKQTAENKTKNKKRKHTRTSSRPGNKDNIGVETFFKFK